MNTAHKLSDPVLCILFGTGAAGELQSARLKFFFHIISCISPKGHCVTLECCYIHTRIQQLVQSLECPGTANAWQGHGICTPSPSICKYMHASRTNCETHAFHYCPKPFDLNPGYRGRYHVSKYIPKEKSNAGHEIVYGTNPSGIAQHALRLQLPHKLQACLGSTSHW
jgi:hypothetical protein